MGDIHCLYKIKVNSGMIFLKRESLLKKTAEEASQGMLVGHIRGETFRQKD